ncbi:hypothetical protein KO465_04880 [Candidatus Micrarchaeota archaeon]|nr:hypothetical protein [Candidatus Micrarchaeota archaeon]
MKDNESTNGVEKRAKKLSKVIEGNILTITEGNTGTVLTFDAETLPDEIQEKLMPYGLSQKLGDAAAGRSGQEAVDAINRVWEGLMENKWTTRLPAAQKITKKTILDKFNAITDPNERAIAEKMLKDLGVIS